VYLYLWKNKIILLVKKDKIKYIYLAKDKIERKKVTLKLHIFK